MNHSPLASLTTKDASGKDAKKCVNTGYVYDAPDANIANSISKISLQQELVPIFSISRADLNTLRIILRGMLSPFPLPSLSSVIDR
jgi:hypothetical protein